MIYALGRGTEYFDMPLIRSIVQRRGEKQLSFLFAAGARRGFKSEPFQMNGKLQDQQ